MNPREWLSQIGLAFGPDFSASHTLLVLGLVFARYLATLSFTPYLGMRPVPANVRAVTAFLFTVFSAPFILSSVKSLAIPTSNGLILGLFLKEVIFGFILGAINLILFYSIQSAGSMIDNQRSLANARIFNPALGSQASILGIFFYQLALAAFLGTNGHLYFLTAVVRSFETVPILSFPAFRAAADPANEMIHFVISLTSDSLIICLQIAAPVVIALFIADLIMGLMNRIAPMINVFEMGFNVKALLAAWLIYLSIGLFLTQAQSLFVALRKHIEMLVRIFYLS